MSVVNLAEYPYPSSPSPDFPHTGSHKCVDCDVEKIVMFKFFIMLPLTLAGKSGGNISRPSDTYKVVRRIVPKEFLNRVKSYSKEHGSSLNDVLLRDLFVALGSWNKISGTNGIGRKVTIAIPVCMRGEKYQIMSASNFASMHFLHVPNRLLTKQSLC